MEDSQVTDHLVWAFGNCSLDERRLQLSVAGEIVDVEARPLELLLELLRHAEFYGVENSMGSDKNSMGSDTIDYV